MKAESFDHYLEMLAMEESLEFLKKEVAVVEQEETKMKSKEVDIKHEVEKYESVYALDK